MATGRASWVICDQCDAQTPSDLSCGTVAEARRWARSAGWHQNHADGDRPTRDICPDCWDEGKR